MMNEYEMNNYAYETVMNNSRRSYEDILESLDRESNDYDEPYGYNWRED